MGLIRSIHSKGNEKTRRCEVESDMVPTDAKSRWRASDAESTQIMESAVHLIVGDG
jgi:hypothetical protein